LSHKAVSLCTQKESESPENDQNWSKHVLELILMKIFDTEKESCGDGHEESET
jgi:hypothetical protein